MLIIALLIAALPQAAPQVIDRILAVVEGQIVTLSDVRAAQRLRLIPPDVSADPVGAALQRLIDRRLILAEVDRYMPAEPSRAAVDEALAALQAPFGDALAFEIALNQTALSHEELRRHVRDSLRIRAYLDQRFGSMMPPSEDDVARYYREHAADFTMDGTLPPFAAVRAQARARLLEERREQFEREWLEGLRQRGHVVLLYLPGR